jgi:4-hydroxy-tetrahydrodipicolinate reductase
VIEKSHYDNWTLESPKTNEILIEAKRIENIPGTHTVNYNSAIDAIEIKHTAHNREGFALGAVIAAEWIVGKQGIFAMKDVLSLNLK